MFQDNFGLAKDSALASKLLMGLNFYGYRYLEANYGHPEAITGNTLISQLKKLPVVIKWNTEYAEHKFTYDDEITTTYGEIYFPTLKSIKERLDLAEKLGVGVAVWEAGQGLNYWGGLF